MNGFFSSNTIIQWWLPIIMFFCDPAMTFLHIPCWPNYNYTKAYSISQIGERFLKLIQSEPLLKVYFVAIFVVLVLFVWVLHLQINLWADHLVTKLWGLSSGTTSWHTSVLCSLVSRGVEATMERKRKEIKEILTIVPEVLRYIMALTYLKNIWNGHLYYSSSDGHVIFSLETNWSLPIFK